MNKREIIEYMADKYGFTKCGTEMFMTAFIETIKDLLLVGESVHLHGLGEFSVVHKKAQNRRNFATGKIELAPDKDAPHFIFSDIIKKKVENGE